MRRIAWIAAMSVLCGFCNASAQDKDIKQLADRFADALSKLAKRSVAVVDFNDLQGNVTELGRYMAEQLSVAFATAGKGIEVVDRTHLRALIQENKLSSSGIIDPATARKLGQIAGVDVLVTGTLTPFGDSVQLAVKALDTTTARIVTASTADIARTKAIDELLNRGIAQVETVGQRPLGPTEPQRSNKSITVKDYEFTLDFCSFQRGNVICTFQVRNLGPDAGLFICSQCGMYGQSNYPHIIDNRGNEYVAKRIQLGNDVANPGGVQRQLVTNVPIAASMQFDDVSPDANSLTLLEFVFDTDGGWHPQRLKAQLRNIPLRK